MTDIMFILKHYITDYQTIKTKQKGLQISLQSPLAILYGRNKMYLFSAKR